MAEKKYYWLKLKRDFFKRHDIRIIEAMPNGKDYILFYLKLLLESVDHEGNLRFSDTIPYNEQMLSIITNTNIDIVRAAMGVFRELKMIEILNDQTIYMAEVEKLIGSETKWAEKKRVQRAKEDNVPLLSSKCPIEKEKDQEKHLYLEKDIIVAPGDQPSTEEAEPSKTKKNIMADFENLWKIYPRKIGKKKALDAYARAVKKGVSFETIKQGIENYCKHIESKKIETAYIKHGSTWFNGECWNDEYSGSQEQQQESPTEANPGFDEWMNNFMGQKEGN